ncbi:kynurenine 3-monooxygenase [Ekhidna lutea]|uniref:Kynurenine 3-monooxygenase n=1 Tax=Ekhidna lutea TaxID=447679 RepID=A0A239IMP5_EKHLU|nr:NAD(P)/FAD-dependent oxidoreductase [Ekhidna lutea]SNS94662.1 kynurenine 3-monooxygenase [Ekhidna lutea]
MKDKIGIVGAGLVGSLLAVILKKKGFQVQVFEKRSDPRKSSVDAGRSINLALSHRGIQPLKLAGVYETIAPFLIPMKGRMMHDETGKLTFQPYGKEGQFINSVSRAQLNQLLIESAEEAGVEVLFDHKCVDIDFDSNIISFENESSFNCDLIVGTDGAFSAVRKKLQFTDRFNFSQHYIEHGYKELCINPKNGEFGLEPNYLHIWPRGNFMLIALPNNDKTFTCTLFFPFEGSPSFEELTGKAEVEAFFTKYFRDAKTHMPDITDQYFNNPTSSLITTKCEPWHKNRTILLGDAAHAIVPFYGQGMNSGFEDVRLFIEMAESENWDWKKVLPDYSAKRKKDADAISELALYNFIEMRDHVGDPNFLKRKKLEAQIQERYPKEWIPLYSMVTFSNMPYSEALRLGKIQKKIMDDVLENEASEINLPEIIERFNTLKRGG